MYIDKNFATRLVHRSILLGKKYSPTILTSVGIIGGVVAAVLGAKATLKLEDTVNSFQEDLADVKERKAGIINGFDEDVLFSYTKTDRVKDLTRVYTNGALSIVKLYGPAVSLGVASIGCIVGAHGIMQKRNVAMVAAYSALDKAFDEYRKRVSENLGEEAETRIRTNDGGYLVENDKKSGEVVNVITGDPNKLSPYAKFFDESSPNWQKDPEYNLLFVRCQQNFANDMLRARGHVFLNEVYDMLGIDRSSAGSVVGWVLNKQGDNFVDFGIYRGASEDIRAFVNGNERSILLDFNVDGLIYDKI